MMASERLVRFRRERTAWEFQQYGQAEGRWKDLGQTHMSQIPQKGEYVWLDGRLHVVGDRTWSIRTRGSALPPAAMLTLLDVGSPDQDSLAPDRDFLPDL